MGDLTCDLLLYGSTEVSIMTNCTIVDATYVFTNETGAL